MLHGDLFEALNAKCCEKIGSRVFYLMVLVTKSNVVPKRFLVTVATVAWKEKYPFIAVFYCVFFRKTCVFINLMKYQGKSLWWELFCNIIAGSGVLDFAKPYITDIL